MGKRIESTFPVLPTATGAYDARPPVESLLAHFARTWRNVLPDTGAPIAVVPDGCIDLEWIDGKLRVAGADLEVKCESLRPGATVIGFRFRAGAASQWLGVPASEITTWYWRRALPFTTRSGSSPTEPAAVIFTLLRLPGVSEQKFEEDARAVEKDLTTLRAVLERS